MAQNLQLLKRRIKTSKNIAQIAKALEMIAASKIKKAQKAANGNRPYAERVSQVTEEILSSIDRKKFSHPYLTESKNQQTLLIAISPDRGLCGSLNTNLYKKLLEIDNSDLKVVTVGKKIGLFASKLKCELLSSYPMGSTLPDFSLVYQLKTIVDDEYSSGNVGNVQILYAESPSLFVQTPNVKTLLPFVFETKTDSTTNGTSIFEPNKEDILQELLPYYLEIQLFNALLQAFTSEQAAQMIAMQNAKNNARDIAEYLNLVYNKSRQERITNEILDLSNSAQI